MANNTKASSQAPTESTVVQIESHLSEQVLDSTFDFYGSTVASCDDNGSI